MKLQYSKKTETRLLKYVQKVYTTKVSEVTIPVIYRWIWKFKSLNPGIIIWHYLKYFNFERCCCYEIRSGRYQNYWLWAFLLSLAQSSGLIWFTIIVFGRKCSECTFHYDIPILKRLMTVGESLSQSSP